MDEIRGGKRGISQTAYEIDGGVFGMGFRKLPGGVSLFFHAVFVRIAVDDLDDVADNTPAGCIYENTPMIEHTTNEPAHAGAPRIEISLKTGGVHIIAL